MVGSSHYLHHPVTVGLLTLFNGNEDLPDLFQYSFFFSGKYCLY